MERNFDTITRWNNAFLMDFWVNFKAKIKEDIESIFGLKYKLCVINTKSNPGLYLWENWQQLYLEIDNLIKLSDSQTFIRSFQSFEFENKWLEFGRMSWSEENNKKWTTKYRTKEISKGKLLFFSTEIWSPDWNYYYKTGKAPEIFIQIFNSDYNDIREGIVFAIKLNLWNKNENYIYSIINKIQTKIPNSTLSTVERYWTPSKGFYNSIEDITLTEIDKMFKIA